MTITNGVMRELRKKSTSPIEGPRQAQIERFKKLKKKLDEAGYVYGDKYELPLMERLGRPYCKMK